MNSTFTLQDLEKAIGTLKDCKSPGPDKITNEMIKHLGPKAKKVLLEIFNKSWKSGQVPQSWREAHMVPIHKKGKDKTNTGSYRPISLTSCVGKLLERMINSRLIWHLESKKLLSKCQAGFRQDHSTEDLCGSDDRRQAPHHRCMGGPRKGIWQGMERWPPSETPKIWCQRMHV